ncbi:hypothetical protein V6Z11_A07G130200 [Gossypium hirsutum]|uniref:Uncharacterized protein n=1 Tax=Gossypium hirsutum TaxID=3635 RepID=A0A1U8P0Z5_GOSHI|nr:uncharacterized protein LOC107953154 [Gossypium hirsutum]
MGKQKVIRKLNYPHINPIKTSSIPRCTLKDQNPLELSAKSKLQKTFSNFFISSSPNLTHDLHPPPVFSHRLHRTKRYHICQFPDDRSRITFNLNLPQPKL